jgi:hypothetical protein
MKIWRHTLLSTQCDVQPPGPALHCLYFADNGLFTMDSDLMQTQNSRAAEGNFFLFVRYLLWLIELEFHKQDLVQ